MLVIEVGAFDPLGHVLLLHTGLHILQRGREELRPDTVLALAHLGSRRGEAPLMVAVDLRLGNIQTALIVDELDVLQVLDNAAELD